MSTYINKINRHRKVFTTQHDGNNEFYCKPRSSNNVSEKKGLASEPHILCNNCILKNMINVNV